MAVEPLNEQPANADIFPVQPFPELFEQTVPALGSRDVLTNPLPYIGGSEFGGVDGYVQPAPHIPTASERMAQIMAIDPADDGTEATSVLPPDLTGDFQ